MLDGPTVLGWDTWHELDERYAVGTLRTVLSMAAQLGRIDQAVVEPLSHLLTASFARLVSTI